MTIWDTERVRMCDRKGEKSRVRCTEGGEKDGYDDWYLDSELFLGYFRSWQYSQVSVATAHSCPKRPTNPAGLGAVSVQAVGWTLVAATQQGRQCTQTKAKLHRLCPAIKLKAFRLCCCCLHPFLKRQEDTKDKRKQGKRWLHELYDIRGYAGFPPPHLFLTSSSLT